MKKNLTIILLFISFFSIGQKYDFVKILPGQGIVYNNDSILLKKTSITDTFKTLKIKDTSNPNVFSITNWDGIDSETGEWTSGTVYTREIEFKSITFNFSHETSLDSLELNSIEIKENSNLKIYTDNGIMIGMINPKIKEYYPLIGKQDYISDSGLTYNLYKYGISFQLEKLENNDLRLIEISTHLIYE